MEINKLYLHSSNRAKPKAKVAKPGLIMQLVILFIILCSLDKGQGGRKNGISFEREEWQLCIDADAIACGITQTLLGSRLKMNRHL